MAKEIDELTRKGPRRQSDARRFLGGTFTVNNTGSFGSILSYPIINYPQAANFTFESIVKRPVVIDDMIAVRSMVNLCLSLDHRILDGVICGRFLQRVKENLEVVRTGYESCIKQLCKLNSGKLNSTHAEQMNVVTIWPVSMVALETGLLFWYNKKAMENKKSAYANGM